MRMKMRLAVLSAGFALLSLPAGADDRLSDRAGTLEPSEELDARGRLGGVTVDALGFLCVANFRDEVWKISPEGRVETLTRSLYGSSGNAIDSRGDLFQANFQGHTIDRISRTGEV
jgi:sugar lactone lactonase YvrE